MATKKRSKLETVHNNGLAYFLPRLMQSKFPEAVVDEARMNLATIDFANLLSYVLSMKSFRFPLFGPRKVRNLKDINTASYLKPVRFDRELSWAIAYLQKYVDQLEQFEEAKQQFAQALLLDDYERAYQTLDQIESTFGFSMWLLCNRMLLRQTAEGMESQKSYLRSFLDMTKNQGMHTAIAYFISIRNEVAVTPARFVKQFEQVLDDNKMDDSLRAFLRFHILPQTPFSTEDARDVLYLSALGSLLDYYEATVRICADQSARNKQGLSKQVIAMNEVCKGAALKRTLAPLLHKSIPLAEIKGDLQICVPSNDTLAAYDEFLKGNYNKSTEMCMDMLARTPDSFTVMLIAAQSLACLPDATLKEQRGGTMIQDIVHRMSEILARRSDIGEHLTALHKIAYNNSTHLWADSLLAFIYSQTSSAPLGFDGELERIMLSDWGGSLHPILIISINDEELRTKYMSAASELVPDCLGLKYAHLYFSDMSINVADLDVLSPHALQLLKAHLAYRQKNYRLSSQFALALCDAAPPYYTTQSLRIASNGLLDDGDVAAAIVFSTSALMHREYIMDIFPMGEIATSINDAVREALVAEISLSIFIDLISRYVDRRKLDDYRISAFQDFLDSLEITIPSQIGNHVSTIEPLKLIYFLKHICVESVLSLTGTFPSSQAIAEERLAICKLLIELDSEHANLYYDEINEINQGLIIHKGMRNLEQSKIYVDKDSIRRSSEKSLKEGFNRYIALLQEGTGDFGSLLDALKAITSNFEVVVYNEATRALATVVRELRDQYVSNNEAGLDGYLSVNIRHGTLFGQLRSPLVASRLITTKDSLTGEYNDNIFWADVLNIHDPVQRTVLLKSLAEFSKSFDDTIQMVIKDWIQIRRKKEDVGLFNFVLNEYDVVRMPRHLHSEISYDDFISYLLNYLDEMLEASLETIRQQFISHIKPTFNQLLTDLADDVEGMIGHERCREFTNTIRATLTELLLTVDRVIEWFKFSEGAPSEVYDIATVIRIGAANAKTFSPNFDVEISVNVPEPALNISGRMLNHYANIFSILFENIVRHSKMNEYPKGIVTIVVLDVEKLLCRVENKLSPDVNKDEVRTKLAKIKSEMLDASSSSRVRSEGGTGFHKVRKILLHDIGITPELKFEISEQETFFVEFSVPLADLWLI